jgi:formate-dependent nitrite reductase membrane component NrfD
MTTVVAIAALLKQPWAARFLTPLSLSSAAVAAVYLIGLALGNAETRHAFAGFWQHDGLWLIVALLLLAATPALVRRVPLAAAVLPLVGATVVRSLIVEAGQAQFFGF